MPGVGGHDADSRMRVASSPSMWPAADLSPRRLSAATEGSGLSDARVQPARSPLPSAVKLYAAWFGWPVEVQAGEVVVAFSGRRSA